MKSFSVFAVIVTSTALSVALAHTGNNSSQLINRNQSVNAAFPDGVYLGTLAARRGEAPHVASGRWASAPDRQSFTEGYTSAYEQIRALLQKEKANPQTIGSAAYRDGLYLGKLDAEPGRTKHIASGRWVEWRDRESFAAGYRQAYAETTSMGSGKAKGASEASLTR